MTDNTEPAGGRRGHPVHRTIICVDVEKFADYRRTFDIQLVVRKGMYDALREALTVCGIRWDDCDHEDRGDGILLLVPADVPKDALARGVPRGLVAALDLHNHEKNPESMIRLRVAIHAGEVQYDEYGVTGTAVNHTFRLLDAERLKQALATSTGAVGVIASGWFFEEVIRQDPGSQPASYKRVRIRVKETVTDAYISLPGAADSPADEADLSPENRPASVPRQLPAAVPDFAGRKSELAALAAWAETARSQETVAIAAIDGMAGIGKSALAVHSAHHIADRFPDGQLYVNLRGFDPTDNPMPPAEAIRGFLDALQVRPDNIPVGLHAQEALYRSILAGRKVLVVLDNARGIDQVRPLLPGSAGCMVILTSRNRLTSLIGAGAWSMSLDLLTPSEARHLLSHRIGATRVAAEPDPTQAIINACGRLPLALSIVAARATTRPEFSLAALAAELRNAQDSLSAFDLGDHAMDIRDVFSWSYQGLGAPAARLFQLLALHPGPDISWSAAASLAGSPPHTIRGTLAELTRSHLLNEHVPGRFVFHDLLRAYARERASRQIGAASRRNAEMRILDHYLRTAREAALLLEPGWMPITPLPALRGVTPDVLRDYVEARTWFQTEHAVLLAVLRSASAGSHDHYLWQLPWMLTKFFDRWGHWADLADVQQNALAAAERLADDQARAHSHRGFGRACLRLGRFDDALLHFREALKLFEILGDQTAQALTHVDLCWLLGQQGRHAEGLPLARRALELARTVGSPTGQARALNFLGWYLILTGDPEHALEHCETGLGLYRQARDLHGEARTLHSLGYARHHLGRHLEAIADYRQALGIYREIGEHYRQAMVLAHLGDAYAAIGDPPAACTAWQEALKILERLGEPPEQSRRPGYLSGHQIRARLLEPDS